MNPRTLKRGVTAGAVLAVILAVTTAAQADGSQRITVALEVLVVAAVLIGAMVGASALLARRRTDR